MPSLVGSEMCIRDSDEGDPTPGTHSKWRKTEKRHPTPALLSQERNVLERNGLRGMEDQGHAYKSLLQIFEFRLQHLVMAL